MTITVTQNAVSEVRRFMEEQGAAETAGLRLRLTGAQKKKLRRRTTVDPEAYQEYLRAERQDDFVDNISRRLLTYALGRALVLSDNLLVADFDRPGECAIPDLQS